MSDSVETVSNQQVQQAPAPSQQAPDPSEDHLRVVGALFANGPVAPAQQPPIQRDAPRHAAAPPSTRALANVPPQLTGKPSGMERALGALRHVLPLVQRVLPLLDGNIGTAVSNILSPHSNAPTPPPVNLTPIHDGLADLRVQHRALRDQVAEQNSSLKRVGDQLQQVREATDRNTLEQQELLHDLKSVGNKVNIFAFIALALLGISVVLNAVLYLQIRHIIP
jgi:hypothetical protein